MVDRASLIFIASYKLYFLQQERMRMEYEEEQAKKKAKEAAVSFQDPQF